MIKQSISEYISETRTYSVFFSYSLAIIYKLISLSSKWLNINTAIQSKNIGQD